MWSSICNRAARESLQYSTVMARAPAGLVTAPGRDAMMMAAHGDNDRSIVNDRRLQLLMLIIITMQYKSIDDMNEI